MQVKTSDGYDNLYPQTSINNVQGIQDQYYDKEAIISNNTLTSLGLSESSTPDDVFQLLGRFNNNLGNEYLWGKYKQITEYDQEVSTNQIIVQFNVNQSQTYIINYGDSYSIDNNKKFILNNSNSLTVGRYTSPSEFNVLRGKYYFVTNAVSNSSSSLNYIEDKNAQFTTSYEGVFQEIITTSSIINFSNIRYNFELIDYLNSQNENAYPPIVADEYIYEVYGKLGGKANISIGQYTGNGQYGQSHPNILTFKFTPKIIFINAGNQVSGQSSDRFIIPGTISNFYTGGSSAYGTIASSIFSTTVSWYSPNNSTFQLNDLNVVYNYIGIG